MKKSVNVVIHWIKLRITNKGVNEITIPKSVIEELGWTKGSELSLEYGSDFILIRKKKDK